MKIEPGDSGKIVAASDAILENLLDAVLVVNSGGNIIYANHSARELFSKTSKQLLGQPFGFPIVPNDVQEIEVLKGGQVLTAQMLASHISWNGQTASLLSLRDVTAQKQVVRELSQERKLLEKSNEENAQYASLASHDLKEPIRKILIFSDRLLTGFQLSTDERSLIRKIHTSAVRMQSLIGGIAELSKITHTPHAFSSVDLQQVVKEVVNDLELQIQEKRAIVEVSDLPAVDGIYGKVYQLFLNLVANALKYSRDEVRPRISIQQVQADDGFVGIECADNGIGFNDDAAKKLFEPFQRLHTTRYDGMGIGLTLCQKIVELHQGKITATGVPGKGARFLIQLPLQRWD